MKTAHHCKHLGHSVHVGGRKPSPVEVVKKFPQFRAHAKKDGLAPPPPACDFSPLAMALLILILGNDKYGCCVEAAGYHIVGTETSNADDPIDGDPQLTSWALSDYGSITGFDPKKPDTDQGTDPASALTFWKKIGFLNGTKLAGWLSVNANNRTQVMQAISLTENAFIGIGMPDAWVAKIDSMEPGFVWDVEGDPNPDNGHMICAVGYNEQGLIVVSWGMVGIMTWAAVKAYATSSAGGEFYSLLTPDQLNKAKQTAPNGFNWAGLVAAFDELGGSVPVPTPTPAPAPPAPAPAPTPSPNAQTVTLSQVEEWATSHLRGMTGATNARGAIERVKKGLRDHWARG